MKPKHQIIAVTKQSVAISNAVPGSPNGFLDRTDLTLSWDNLTRTLTITPVSSSYQFYSNGILYTKDTVLQYQITNVSGGHLIYFDDNGELGCATELVPEIIHRWAFVAYVYWNLTLEKAVPDCFAELHGADMSSDTHDYLHNTVGTAYHMDGGIEPTVVNIDGDGSTLDNLQISVTTGIIHDEDVPHIVPAKLASDLIPVLYRTPTGEWFFDKSSSAIVRPTGTGRAAYNYFDGASWSLAEVPSGSYVLAHLYAIPGINDKLMIIMGSNVYSNLNNLRRYGLEEIKKISDVPFLEFKSIATFAIHTSDSYTNEAKSAIVTIDTGIEWEDWRVSTWI